MWFDSVMTQQLLFMQMRRENMLAAKTHAVTKMLKAS